MSFIKCPHCRHSALSVASRCPGCGAALGALTLGPEHKGAIVPCLSCGHVVRSRSAACPNCGAKDPAKKPGVPRRTVAISAGVVLGVLLAGGWSRFGRVLENPASAEPAPRELAAPIADVPAPVEPPPPLQIRWTILWANVRTEPRESALILEQLPPGTRIEGVRRPSGWWLVYLDGDSAGYISGALLRSRPPDSVGPDRHSPEATPR